jgi:uncharacterized protein YcfJ
MTHRLASLSVLALTAVASSATWAVEYGRVISSTPVVSSVPMSQRECVNETGAAPSSRSSGSGAGAAVGALFGAALGNTLGHGTGRAASTAVGMIAGAALGNHAEEQEANRNAAAATTQRCRDVTRYEQRAVGYDVVYEYQGVQRSVRLAQPPGDRIALEVQVMPAGAMNPPVSAMPPQLPAQRPVYRMPGDAAPYDDRDAPRTVYVPAPAPVYAAQPVAVNPWPYVVAGGVGAWVLVNATRDRGRDRGHGHWRHR